MMNLLLVALGGSLGAITRYILGVNLNKISQNKPYGTWVANVTGSFLLGVLFILFQKHSLNESLWLLTGVGFCGAYTTFSTFGVETLNMLLDKNIKKAFMYVVSSFLVSFLFVGILFLLFL